MKKETYYFSHDYNTRNDFKIKKMIMKLGYTAYGVYWALIEDLYNNDNKIIFLGNIFHNRKRVNMYQYNMFCNLNRNMYHDCNN